MTATDAVEPGGPEVELVRGGPLDEATWRAVLVAVRSAGATARAVGTGRSIRAAWGLAGRMEATGRVPIRSRADLVRLDEARRAGA